MGGLSVREFFLERRDFRPEVHRLRKRVADLEKHLGLRDSRIRQLEEELRKQKERASKLPPELFRSYAFSWSG